jgi:hypothetical protein
MGGVLIKLRKWAAVFLLLIILPAVSASVERQPQTLSVLRGAAASLIISYSIQSPSVIITEQLPAGFYITGSSPSYRAFNATANEYKWLIMEKTNSISGSIYYNLSVPSTANGEYTITGSWKYIGSDSSRKEGNISGTTLAVGTAPVQDPGSDAAGKTETNNSAYGNAPASENALLPAADKTENIANETGVRQSDSITGLISSSPADYNVAVVAVIVLCAAAGLFFLKRQKSRSAFRYKY